MSMFVASAFAQGAIDGSVGITVTHGLTLADGDVLYAFLFRGDANTGSAPNQITAFDCSGWTTLSFQQNSGGNDRSGDVQRKVIVTASGEPASYTWTTTGDTDTQNTVVVLIQTRTGDTGTPEDATTTVLDGSNDFTPDAPDITTVTGGSLVITVHGAAYGAAESTAGDAAGAPSGYTLQRGIFQSDAGAHRPVLLAVATLETTTPGAQTPGVWTHTPDEATREYLTWTVAVRSGYTPVTGRYLLESGSPDGYLLEDSSGVLIGEDATAAAYDPATSGAGIWHDAPQEWRSPDRYQPDEQASGFVPLVSAFDPMRSPFVRDEQTDRDISQRWYQPDAMADGFVPIAPSLTAAQLAGLWPEQPQEWRTQTWDADAEVKLPATPPGQVINSGRTADEITPYHTVIGWTDPSGGSSALTGVRIYIQRDQAITDFASATLVTTVGVGVQLFDDYWGDVCDYPAAATRFLYWLVPVNAEGLTGPARFLNLTISRWTAPWHDWDGAEDAWRDPQRYQPDEQAYLPMPPLANAPIPGSWSGWDASQDVNRSQQWFAPEASVEGDIPRTTPVVDSSTVAQRAAILAEQPQDWRPEQWYAEPAEVPSGPAVEWDPSLALTQHEDQSGQQDRWLAERWYQPDEQVLGDIPRASAPTVGVTVAQMAALWPEQPQDWRDAPRYQPDEQAAGFRPLANAYTGMDLTWDTTQDRAIGQQWFAPDASVEGLRPLANAPTGLDFGRDHQQDQGNAQQWYQPDEQAISPVALTLPSAPSAAQLAGLWQEQSQDRSLDQVWYQPDESANGFVPILDVAPVTTAQLAGLWPEQPQEWQDAQRFAPDEHVLGDIPRASAPTLDFTPAQMAPMWAEQPQEWRDARSWAPEASVEGLVPIVPMVLQSDSQQDAWQGWASAPDLSVEPITSPPTTAQLAGIWPEQPAGWSDASPWHQPDEQATSPVSLTLPSAPTAGQLAGLWYEQPQEWRETRWFAPDPSVEGSPPVVTKAQIAGIWYDQPQGPDLSQTWFAPDAAVEGRPPIVTVLQLAGLWQEQPGQERSLAQTWFAPDESANGFVPIVGIFTRSGRPPVIRNVITGPPVVGGAADGVPVIRGGGRRT